jgi:lipoate---protein ligase
MSRQMQLLDLTLPTPAENLALDEALLEAAEAGELNEEILRLWESPQPLVVIGRSSRSTEEVDLPACDAVKVPVLRRSSGGGAVVAGRGCLLYAVVQRYAGREHLRLLDEVHRQVLGTVRPAIGSLAGGVEHLGTCDLAIGGRKFSGNAVRCKRDHFLYHGTLLYDFDLSLIERLLRSPPRQPAYRSSRSHLDFVMNLDVSVTNLRQAIATAFGAHQSLVNWPAERTRHLVATRYSQDVWNFER